MKLYTIEGQYTFGTKFLVINERTEVTGNSMHELFKNTYLSKEEVISSSGTVGSFLIPCNKQEL